MGFEVTSPYDADSKVYEGMIITYKIKPLFGIKMDWMTEITHVRGQAAHPFYAWVRKETGFSPSWNFNKVLIAPDGSIAGTFEAGVRPEGAEIAGRIEAMLQ